MPSPLWNNTTIPYGTRVLTIAAVIFIANNIRVNRPVKIIKRTNQIDDPTGSVGIADFVEGSCELQMATSTTALPASGATFTVTFDATIGAEVFYVANIEAPEEKAGDRKINITFIKQY